MSERRLYREVTSMKTAKNSRQEKILSLIRDNDISTQEDLTAKVNQSGFEATQATISRDITSCSVSGSG